MTQAGGAVAELLDRADAYANGGDAKAAMSFYQAALQGAQTLGSVDATTLDRLRSAQAFIQTRAQEFRRALDASFSNAAPSTADAALRLDHSIAMLKGERQIFVQQPSVFYYPYLPQRQFYEREEFDWVAELESETPAIREELLGLVNDGADFRPYIENEPDRPHRDFHGLNENRSWTALYLWRNAQMVEANAKRCPRTVAALDKVPLSNIGSQTPSVLFSRLEPGAHIPPHSGMLNCRLICHLPLIVPNGCWLRVGNETREWEEGKLLIFDDSMDHEAKNPSGELRIILLFDIWRPELSREERGAISSIFGAIDEFRGASES
ncbi:MAG: aspartyl/asparaginyl beta-hydroxylase domain-containing protein [Sphingomonas sp.]|nr:aspartyl/asparaginyl beta-hydroxylase domain-containing protein [Sphingomonas sp.]